MALGPGKYDQNATALRKVLKADGIFLCVIDGKHGPGFSIQAEPHIIAMLPGALRDIANDLEKDVQDMMATINAKN